MVIVGIIVGVSNVKKNGENVTDDAAADTTMTLEEAETKIAEMAASVNASEAELKKASVDLTDSSLASEVPSIDQYPLSVKGNGSVNIEIFATSEKSGSDKDGWINDVATQFNSEQHTLADGRTIGVSIRPMASGLGSDYIVSKVYEPTAYTPSNELFGAITNAKGGNLTLVDDTLVKNVAGILLTEDVKTTIKSKYDEVSMKTVVQATEDNVISMGYTSPLSSATGLNFLVSTLYMYDSSNILSDAAVTGFRDFQNNVPYVAYTTLQMRESAKSGALNGMVMEYQTYINDPELSENYDFIPFGVPHNNPIYATADISEDEREALDIFVQYCKNENSQALATEYGFNQMEYSSDVDLSAFTNKDIADAQVLWKENKDLDKEIIAVFVADVSGSMDGEPINQLKSSLINGAKYIGDNVQVGLVSYSDSVTIRVPIAKFDLNQRAYFQGAVEGLYATGGTASYNALMVAADMLIEAKQQSPDAKIMLFLLSDGQANIGYELSEIKDVIDISNIPVYTIAYGEQADSAELGSLSAINEAAAINASSEDVIYKIKSLFNSEM
ncbi:MAG: VWA domain-containing protein [Lachnospiraceae bacterium]|nr:VWA domain-containing protein [Lachnospiraceae bacterium]